MIQCTSCGKPIEKMPDWLAGVKVDFVCNNCPNRHTKNIAFVSLEPAVIDSGKGLDEDEETDVEEVADNAEVES